MSEIAFSKLSGSGNDFILIDNRRDVLPSEELIRAARLLCRRKFSVGADGLIALEDSEKADFRWQFFNADGSSAEMCGNGGRCAARFAVERGIAGPSLCFETLAGLIRAEVNGRRVKLELPDPEDLRTKVEIPLEPETFQADFINTGVPHVVIIVEDIENVDVRGLGRKIRHHPLFAPAGTNVNFVQKDKNARIFMRTYERGVEDETLACGTGAVASACIGSRVWDLDSPVEVRTRGGEILNVYLSGREDRFRDVFLEGETLWVYDGTYRQEALKET